MKRTANLLSHLSRLKNLAGLFTSKKFAFGFSLVVALVAIGFSAPFLTDRDPIAVMKEPMDQPPSNKYPLGTDTLGRDIFAQLVYGLQSSFIIGFVAGTEGMIFGIFLGLMAGLRPGILDTVLTRFIDVFLVMPVLPLLVIIASMLPYTSILLLGAVIGIFSWPWTARSIRSQVLSLREREFVSLARLSGSNDLEIVFKEILPNMLSYIGALFASAVAGGMIGEAGISLLGVGPQDVSTLGMILYWAQSRGATVRGMWWWWFPPALCFILVFIGLQSINMGLDEIYNPRLRK